MSQAIKQTITSAKAGNRGKAIDGYRVTFDVYKLVSMELRPETNIYYAKIQELLLELYG